MARDTQQEVTDRIVAALENGTAPWVKPWKSVGGADGCVDHNLTNGREYNGVNVILLWMTRDERGYNRTGWVTYKQAKKLGGNVKRGEKGTQVVLWKPVKGKGKTAEAADNRRGDYLLCRTYTVFNVEQCENLPAKFDVKPVDDSPKAEEARIAACEEFAKNTDANIEHGGNRAFYQPTADSIRLPEFAQFKTDGDYYSTLFHELTHWTGIEKRCDRDLRNRFGSEAYAAEELIAELGAAFLCAQHGIDGKLQHANYIENWLKVLKNDKRAIFTAASKAKQAVKFLNDCQANEDAATDKVAA